MTTDQIDKLITTWLDETTIADNTPTTEDMRRLVRAAVGAEMDACAKVCEDRQRLNEERCPDTCKCSDGWHCAAAIRNRKEAA